MSFRPVTFSSSPLRLCLPGQDSCPSFFSSAPSPLRPPPRHCFCPRLFCPVSSPMPSGDSSTSISSSFHHRGTVQRNQTETSLKRTLCIFAYSVYETVHTHTHTSITDKCLRLWNRITPGKQTPLPTIRRLGCNLS